MSFCLVTRGRRAHQTFLLVAFLLFAGAAGVHRAGAAWAQGASGGPDSVAIVPVRDTFRADAGIKLLVRNSTDAPVWASFCGAALQKRTPEGAWKWAGGQNCGPSLEAGKKADSLRNASSPGDSLSPDRGAFVAPGAQGEVVLRSSLMQSLFPGHGAGTYRVRLQTAATQDSSFLSAKRASAPFRIVAGSRFVATHPGVMKKYASFSENKALAISEYEHNTYQWGYGYGHDSITEAVNRALRECRTGVLKHSRFANCRVLRVNADVSAVEEGAAPSAEDTTRGRR